MGWMSDEMLNSFTKPLIGKYPNTYAFTKAITEAMLDEECKVLLSVSFYLKIPQSERYCQAMLPLLYPISILETTYHIPIDMINLSQYTPI